MKRGRAKVFKQVRLTQLKLKKRVSDLFYGGYQSAFKGHGMVFADVRRYQAGDDVRSINWLLTARTATPYIKIFEEEKGATFLIALDISGSFDFGTRHLKSEVVRELASLIAFSALKGRDKVGLLLFSDRVEHYVPPAGGLKHTLRIVRDIYSFTGASRRTALTPALGFLTGLLKKSCHIFLLSDFLTSEDWARTLKKVRLRHDIIAGVISDPLEKEMKPLGLLPFKDLETGENLLVDSSSPSFLQDYKTRRTKTDHQILKQLIQSGVDYFHIHTNQDVFKQLVSFLKSRRVR